MLLSAVMLKEFRTMEHVMKYKVRVLIVDDSIVVRQALKNILESDPEIQVIATAEDPIIAWEKIRADRPDVITLDVEMPRMDGLTFLKQLMQEDPIAVVMCSSLTAEGSATALTALASGAVEIIQKPRVGVLQFMEEAKIRIRTAVKAAAMARIKPRLANACEMTHTVDPLLRNAPLSGGLPQKGQRIVVVGAATGGRDALHVLLRTLPPNAPGMLIVQHMPEHLTGALARELDKLSNITVKEAAQNSEIVPGCALVAPGNVHAMLKRSGDRYFAELKDGPLVCQHRPSIDVLFRTTARYAGADAIGIILSGMGDDGAKGLLEMKQAGAVTFAQDEETSVIFGMARSAINIGAVDRVLPLQELAGAVMQTAFTAHDFMTVEGSSTFCRTQR